MLKVLKKAMFHLSNLSLTLYEVIIPALCTHLNKTLQSYIHVNSKKILLKLNKVIKVFINSDSAEMCAMVLPCLEFGIIH
jgi:hypothetical protein